MSTTTIRNRIAALAGRAVLGRPIRQPEQPAAATDQDAGPTVDAILDARQTAESYARRMIELAEARETMDAAVEAERQSKHLDFAGAVKAGQELPDLEAIASKARTAQTRTAAIKVLSDREVFSAHMAVLTLRQAAASVVKEAASKAEEAVRELIPPGLFSPQAWPQAFELSTVARECTAAKAEIVKLSACGVPMSKAPLFGMQIPSPYRVEPLPTGKGHILPRDAFDPRKVADDIRTVLEMHLKTMGFLSAVLTEPTKARWTSTQ